MATFVSAALAMPGNFSTAFEGCVKTEFGARVYTGLDDRHCDTVGCALRIGKAAPCLMQASMDDKSPDETLKCPFIESKSQLCACYDCLATEIKTYLGNYKYCPEERKATNELFARVYLDIATSEEKDKAKGWGFSPPSHSQEL
ncbi:hypothetical protein AB1N83_010065 [Pleurotus pulmonarius]